MFFRRVAPAQASVIYKYYGAQDTSIFATRLAIAIGEEQHYALYWHIGQQESTAVRSVSLQNLKYTGNKKFVVLQLRQARLPRVKQPKSFLIKVFALHQASFYRIRVKFCPYFPVIQGQFPHDQDRTV